MNKNKINQSGRSMVEMLGVLAIIGVLSVGGIAGYSKAMAKFKLSKAMDQATTVITNIRTLYSGNPNYSSLSASAAIRMGAIPTEMLNGKSPNSATEAYNAFNGTVEVWQGYSGTNGGVQTFKVIFNGLGKEACVSMMTADWGGSGSGLVSIGTTNGDEGGKTSDGTLPVGLTKAAGLCNKPGDTNSVQWIYY